MNKKNKQTARRYTVVALIVALVACIATAFLGLVKGAAALQLFTPQFPERINTWLWVSGGLVILGVATYAILEPGRFRKFVTGRQARYGSNTLITSIAFVGILIVGNVLAFQSTLPALDMTQEQANTLSPELIAALKALPDNVKATAFFSQNQNLDFADKLLNNIKSQAGGKFEYEFIDPNRNPALVQQFGITGDGKILLQMGEQNEVAASASESEILRSLIRLISPEERVIYFLIGHGERDIEKANENSTSFTQAARTLESKNYTVKTLNLLAENKIPEDADLIVIAGPSEPVTQNEVNLLRVYLNDGGSLLIMEDSNVVTNFGDSADPLAIMLVRDWGISINNDIVIDLNSPEPSVGVSASYDGTHPITRNMNNLATYFPLSRSLTVIEQKEGVLTNLLVQTTERSWGETNLAEQNVAFDESVDTIGPLTLAIAGENTTTGGRIVVYGTSQLANDQYFTAFGNGDLFANSVDWAADQENLTSITPKDPITRSFIPTSQARMLLLMFIVALAIPGMFLVLGIYTWLQRRRQG